MLLLLLLCSVMQTAAAQWGDVCCRFPRFSAQNSAANQVSDGRRATFICTLDVSGVPNFDLGFLEQQRSGSGNFTLSIYLRDPIRNSQVEELWSANRDRLVGINATVEFEAGRGLSLRDRDGSLVWSANSSAAASFGFDCSLGNLALLDSSNRSLWQSFDSPTDTMVQGQTLMHRMMLLSRRSAADPSRGLYSLTVQASGLVLSDESQQQPYWILSVRGANTSSSVATQRCANFSRNSSRVEMYDIGTMGIISCNDSVSIDFRSWPTTNLSSAARFMRLDDKGRLQVFNWNLGSMTQDYDFLGSDCNLPSSCGSFGVCESGSGTAAQCSCLDRFERRATSSNANQGCVLPDGVELPTCSGNNVDFEMVSHQQLESPLNQYSSSRNESTSPEECSSTCLRNCSCQVAFYQEPGQCFYYTGENFQSFKATSDAGNTAFVKLQRLGASNSKRKVVIIVVTVIATFSLVLVALGIFLLRRHRQQADIGGEEVELEEEAFLGALPGLPPRFSMKELEEVSDGFSRKLGQGGFGEVYLGRLGNGTQVAIKRLASAHQGKKEFRAEVATIGNIHHVNLVRLRGFCASGSNRLLVYDYMSNGSLDHWLFSSTKSRELDWNTRFSVALGTARGLAYLHESCKERILHLDIKPQNILLDDKFVAKVADFGLAKLLGGDETHVFTTMRGTPGYLAPEWLTSAISDKSDVYSYGIVLLELVSGRRNFRKVEQEQPLLSFWASAKLEDGHSLEVVDVFLRESMDENQRKQAEKLVSTAVWCVQIDPSHRPPMSTVVLILEGLVEAEKPPPLQQQVDHVLSSKLLDFITSSSSDTTSSLQAVNISSRS